MGPVQFELGGKAPLNVTEDVIDVKQAAITAAEGAFYNNGQSCCSVERIYIAARIYDEFVEALTEEVKSYKIGDPKDLSTFIGSLSRKQQLEVLKDQVEDAIVKGARVLTGGNTIEGEGYYFEPTVLANCNHDMKVMIDE